MTRLEIRTINQRESSASTDYSVLTMRIGITFDLKSDQPVHPGQPDDASEEFDSPATIEAFSSVLRDLGHQVVKLGDGRQLLEALLRDPPDFVFNFAEGQGIGRSREARVPAVLEMLGIPYSGSDPLTLAVTLDKDCAKRLVASAGVVVPRGALIPSNNPPLQLPFRDFKFPLLVKPAWEGSSKGIRAHCLVENERQAAAVVDLMCREYRQPMLIEEYIEGDEITVGILGNEPAEVLGIMRILPKEPNQHFIYSLDVKRDYERLVCYECPAQLSEKDSAAVRRAALTAFEALGCRDVARIDFRVRDGVPYFLEVNPLPGLNPECSDLVIMARLVGWTYPQLIKTIFEGALKRQNLPHL